MIIRAATPEDAARLVAHVHRIVAEADRTAPLDPDEVRGVDDMRLWLAQSIVLVAEDEREPGALLGTVNLRRPSARRALLHAAVLGLSVRRESRGQGIGAALMAAIFEQAARAGITRIELQVFARNAAAIALYEKCGFVHEGRRRGAIRFGDEYLDDLIMAKLLPAE